MGPRASLEAPGSAVDSQEGMLGSLPRRVRRRGPSAAGATVGATDEDRVEASRARRTRAFADRDVTASLLVTAAFCLTAVLMLLLLPMQRHPSPLVWVALIVTYALASRVEFEVGTGAAIPTQ